MVNINKKYFEKRLRTEAWNKYFSKAKSSESAEVFMIRLRMFLTPSEFALFEKRLLIAALLEKGHTYSTIGKMLDVCPSAISFVKHNLTKKPTVHRAYTFGKKEKKERPLLPPYKGMPSIF